MLLIVLLGLIGNLVLVSGDCNLGLPTLHDFDWSRVSGPRIWYLLKHRSNEYEENFDCVRGTIAVPEGDRSLATVEVYDKREGANIAYHGYITHWNSTGYIETSELFELWNGIFRVVAVDYDRYIIANLCRHGTNELISYVAYRSPHPDHETVNEVNREMQDKNVDASQLVDWSADHCPQAESSAAGGSSA